MDDKKNLIKSKIKCLWYIILVAAVAGSIMHGCAPAPTPEPEATPAPTSVPTPSPISVPPSPEHALKRLGEEDYPQFSDNGDVGPLIRSVAMSLNYLRRLPADRPIDFGADHYTASHLICSLETFSRIISAKPSQRRLNQIIRDKFHVYQSVGRTDQKDVLFTGYYEPLLMGDLRPTPEFGTPVLSKPMDMVEIDLSRFAVDLKGRTIVGQYTGKTVVPYPTRKEICQTEGFNEKAPPLVWLRDEIDLLILQIQGSGRVKLPDGRQLHILYDGSNGRPYRSIGRLLIDEGRIPADQMSMQAIRDYLRKKPEISRHIMDYNPRYIFFKMAREGPFGALGQPLTPMRSLAVDRSLMPSAALAFIDAPIPKVDSQGNIENWRPYHGFALAQDAGSAIKGPGRIDLFMGHGIKAEVGAGHLKHCGKLYFLMLKP